MHIRDTLYIKQGDTRTAIKGVLISPKGNPVNLIGAKVIFKLVRYKTTLIERQATILDAQNGEVAFIFNDGETDESGINMKAEFKVTYNDNTTETFPNHDYIRVTILENL